MSQVPPLTGKALRRNVLLSCGVLIVIACILLSLLAAAGVGGGMWQSRVAQAVPTPTRLAITPLPTGTPDPNRLTLAPTPANDLLPAQVSAQMDHIQAQVTAIRGLQPAFDVPRGLLTHNQLRDRVVRDFFKEYSQAQARDDAASLVLFGAIPANLDLIRYYTNLYTEQVAGYYDNQVKEMFVVQDVGFTGVERETYAHEYTHFLQDANFDFQGRMADSSKACKGQSDRCQGVQALIEGDAVTTEGIWLARYGTLQDQQQILSFAQNSHFPVYDQSPEYIKKDFMFPYKQGAEFVQSLYDQGGYNAVDQAFLHPPVSSEQILHPDLYPKETPVAVQLPDLGKVLGAGWRQAEDDTLGEWATFLTLTAGENAAARLGLAEGRKAAAGWGGDHYRVYLRDSDASRVLVLVTEWDTPRDAREFQAAFQRYAGMRFGQPLLDASPGRSLWKSPLGLVQFSLVGSRTIWLIAPDADTLVPLSMEIQP